MPSGRKEAVQQNHDGVTERDMPQEGTENQDDIRATEQDIVDEDKNEHEEDDTVLMQREMKGDYETVLQKLLKDLDAMPGQKAARLSHYIRQMMIDQRREAPHLRNPKLVDRFGRLSALMAVFKGEPPQLRGDEESWCHSVWEDLRPFLEDAELPDGDRAEDVPKPSTSEADAITVVDSQESIQEEGSKRQVAQLANGSQ